jgi:hypothetical protein
MKQLTGDTDMHRSINRPITGLLIIGALAFSVVGADARGGGGHGGGMGGNIGSSSGDYVGGGGHGHNGGGEGYRGGGYRGNVGNYGNTFFGFSGGGYCDPTYPTSNVRHCNY